ncbi:hypothetical protein DFH08DRAFT_881893, partial [Mycena albidolilacea]
WISNSTQVSSLSLRQFSRMRFNKSTKGTTQAIISRFNSSFSHFRCWSMVRPQLHHISKFFPIRTTARCYLFLLISCSIDEGEGILEEYFGQTCVDDAGNGRRMECEHQGMGQRPWWAFNHSVRLFVFLAAIERHPSHVTLSPTNPFSEFAISWWSTGRLMRSLSARERPWFRSLGRF